MKELLSKILSLTENYKKSFDIVSKQMPPLSDPNESLPHSYFIISEILEEIIKIEIQLFEKFLNIVEVGIENLKTSKQHLQKSDYKLLSDGIHQFKYCRGISETLRGRAVFNLSQLKSSEFKTRNSLFNEEEKKEILFSEETFDSYRKKEKGLVKSYDICIAKVSRLFGLMSDII